MSKAVLIAIRPKWCELIASGKKTIEVRKNAPHLKTPFKCYIYCTLSGSKEFFEEACRGDVASWNRSKMSYKKGHVIGEFVCDEMYKDIVCGKIAETDILCLTIQSEHVRKSACLSEKELYEYSNGKHLYGWHISNLVIYDEPKELGEFRRWEEWGEDLRPCQNGIPCEHEVFDYQEDCLACGIDFDGDNCPFYKVQRPPQSWMYVEEMEEDL